MAAARFNQEISDVLLPEHRGVLAEIEKLRDGWETFYAEYADAADTARAEAKAQHGAPTARYFVMLQATNITRFTVNLADGLIVLINADNPSAAPAVTRALFETGCVPCYMAEEIVPRLRKGRTNDVQRILWRLGLGTNDSGIPVRPIAIDALLSAASKVVNRTLPPQLAEQGRGTVARMYAMLSDRTHPGFGAMTLGSMPDEDGERMEHTLRPACDVANTTGLILAAAMMLNVSGIALREVFEATFKYEMVFPNGEPQWANGDLQSGHAAADPRLL